MRTIDIYVLREISRPLAVTLLLSLLVLLVERMLRVLDLVLGSHGPLNLVFQMLAYLVPHYIGLALPLGLFLGILFGLRRLNRDSEFDAVQAAGIGLHGLLRPVILATLLVAAISAATVSHLQPFARYAYRAVVFTVSNAFFQAVLEDGIFSRFEDITFMTEEISSDKQHFRKVFIFSRETARDWVVLTAKEGRLLEDEAGKLPWLWLNDGVRMASSDRQRATGFGQVLSEQNDENNGLPSVLRFDEMKASLGNVDGKYFRPRGEDERELTLTELWERRHDPPGEIKYSDMIAEFNNRLVRILSVLVLPFLAMPLARSQPRRTRPYGVAAGVIILLVYNELLNFGKNAVESQLTGPLVGLWLPFLALAGGSLIYFLHISRQVPGTSIFALLGRTNGGRSGPAGSTAPEPGE